MVANFNQQLCNSRSVEGMDTRGQRLTFYEDMYVRQLRKLNSYGSLHASLQSSPVLGKPPSPSPSTRKTAYQSSSPAVITEHGNHYENVEPKYTPAHLARPMSTPPTSSHRIPLYDHPVNYRRNSPPTTKEDNNNHYYEVVDCSKRLSAESWDGRSISPSQAADKDEPSQQGRLQRQNACRSKSDDHIYAIIPPKRPISTSPQLPYHQYTNRASAPTVVDENNYCVPRSASSNGITSRQMNQQSDIVQARKRWNESHRVSSSRPASATNLRSMRRITRSMDSIRMLHNPHTNRLRNQSMVIAPLLWVKDNDDSRQAGVAASCSSINDSVIGFGRLTRGFQSLDKETSSTESCTNERAMKSPDHRMRLNSAPSGSYRYNKQPRSADDISRSQQSSSNSLQSAGSRCSPRSRNMHHHHHHPQHHHERIKSLPESISSPYENMQLRLSTIGSSGGNSINSNYVNIDELEQQKPELNYADLDLPPPTTKPPLPPTTTPTSKQAILNGSNRNDCNPRVMIEDEDRVEYSVINFKATEAARRACMDQQRYREQGLNDDNSSRTAP